MTTETIHTCSYSCERPGCIRAQRDELAARLIAETSNARGKPVPVLIVYHVGGTHEDVIRALPSGTRLYAAPPSAPVGVDEAAAIRAFEEHFQASSDDPYFEGELELWLTAWRKALAAQQPEARGVVDDAMVDRAGQALYGTDWGSFEGWEADQLRRKVRAVLTAAQQQGGAE